MEALAYSSKKELIAIKGLSEAKVVKMQAEGLSLVHCTHALMHPLPIPLPPPPPP